MNTEWSEARLRSLIEDKAEENLIREYKAADALARSDHHTKEIRKDVSSFANSAGGVLIYGLKEDPQPPHPAIALDAVDFRQISKDWLNDIITSIRPRIEGLDIVAVPASGKPGWGYYVVDVPQSNTAHQGSNYRYYKRFNFKAEPMEDHEIRDVMNRRKVPLVKVEIRIEVREGYSGQIRCRLINLSSVFAERCAIRIRVPTQLGQIVPRFSSLEPERGDDGFAAWELRSDRDANHGSSTLFPHGDQLFDFDFSFEFKPSPTEEGPSLPFVWYEAFADAMTPVRNPLELSEICPYLLPVKPKS